MQEKQYQNITTMKKLLLISSLLPTIVFGQKWENTYMNGFGYSVQETADGGYIVAGEDGSSNAILLKTDQWGDSLWSKTYGGDFDLSTSVIETANGEYVLTGKRGNAVFLMKTDHAGDTIWTRSYKFQNNDVGLTVGQTDDGGFVIFGTSTDTLVKDNVLLIRTDENGDTLWTKLIGGEQNMSGWDGQPTSDGGYMVVGRYRKPSVSGVLLVKTDKIGNVLWIQTYDESIGENGYSGEQTSEGGYIITGTSKNKDILLLKTDINGDIIWTKTYGDNGGNGGYAVTQTSDGGYVITGEKNWSMDESDLFLLRTDDSGELLWIRQYGGEGVDYGYSVQQTSDGGFIVAGCRFETAVGPTIYLIKTDNEGEVLFSIDIPYPNPERRLVKTIDLSGREITKPGRNIPCIKIFDDGTIQKTMNIE